MPSLLCCLTCGALCKGSYCAKHKGVSGGVLGTFRKSVLARAGHRCEYVDDNGQRCAITTHSPPTSGRSPVEAHHRVKRLEGGSNQAMNGVLLCRPHHLIVEREGLGGHYCKYSEREDEEAVFWIGGPDS